MVQNHSLGSREIWCQMQLWLPSASAPPWASVCSSAEWGFYRGSVKMRGVRALGVELAWREHPATSLLLFSRSVVSDSLRLHGLQYSRLTCPSLSSGACSNSRPLSQQCRPTISSSVIPFSSCLLKKITPGDSKEGRLPLCRVNSSLASRCPVTQAMIRP